MSKPLELTVFPSEQECTCCGPIYTMPDGETVKAYQAENMARQKRLTPAELAAEFHKSTADFMSADSMDQIFEDDDSHARRDRARDWMFITETAARFPHHDEDTP